MADLAEIRSNLQVAAALRVPPLYDDLVPPDDRFDPPKPVRLHPRIRVESYEDFIVKAATYRGELEENLLTIQASVKDLEDQWDAIDGWRALVTESRPVQKAIVEAKRKLSPDVYSGIREGKWLADKLRTQIRRLEQDEAAVSRLYTMQTGG